VHPENISDFLLSALHISAVSRWEGGRKEIKISTHRATWGDAIACMDSFASFRVQPSKKCYDREGIAPTHTTYTLSRSHIGFANAIYHLTVIATSWDLLWKCYFAPFDSALERFSFPFFPHPHMMGGRGKKMK
jgi:hypothetical protein